MRWPGTIRAIASGKDLERPLDVPTDLPRPALLYRLYDLTKRLVSAEGGLNETLASVLDAAIDLLGADKGNVQLYDARTRSLRIVAQRGFDAPFMQHFASVIDEAACGVALQRRARVIVEDVTTDAIFAEHRAVMAVEGVLAVQSTPMIGRGGDVLGVISTHFLHHRRFSDEELELLDLYARAAADAIERDLHQRSLNEVSALLDAVFTNSPAGKAVLDAEGRLVRLNDAFARMCGDPAAAQVGRALADVCPPLWGQLESAFHRALAEEGSVRVEVTGIATAGADPPRSLVVAHAVPVGEGAGVGLLASDITEQRRAEDRLQMLNARMRDFISVASHEMRSPLTSVVGFAQRARRLVHRHDPAVSEALRDSIEMVQSEAERLQFAVDLFLDLARVETGQMAFAREPVDVGQLASALTRVLRRRYRHAVIRCDVQEGGAVADANEGAVTQILTNLVDNAVKYGGATPQVRIVVRCEGEQVVVRVRDGGDGIPVGERERIFDAYYRADTSGRQRGTGIGLYVGRELARSLRGELAAVEPEEGGPGAELRLTLPAADGSTGVGPP